MENKYSSFSFRNQPAPITVEEAVTADDLNRVFNLRYKVYVEEENKFRGLSFKDKLMQDSFDNSPNTTNLLMWQGNVPIGTVRLTTSNSPFDKLPSDQLLDFTAVKNAHVGELPASIGMLAIRREYQNRRTFHTLMVALGKVILNTNCDYCIFTLNHECARLIGRLIGATQISEKIWSEEAQNFIIPMLIYKHQVRHFYSQNVLSNSELVQQVTTIANLPVSFHNQATVALS